jgi:hypothetical protein
MCESHVTGKCCRMPSSGMLPHVALVRTDVSEESNASFIKVTRIGKVGTLSLTTEAHSISSQRASVSSYC